MRICILSILLTSLTIGAAESDWEAALAAMEQRHQHAIRELEARHQAEIATLRARMSTLETRAEPAAEIAETVERIDADLQVLEAQQSLINDVDLHIYGSAQAGDFEDEDSAIDTRNIAFAASAEMSDRLRFFSIFELESDSAGGTKVELDQGWMEYRVSDYFRPRFGVVLVPFGRFNIDHFDILNDLSSRPLMARHVVPVSWAESGMGATGSFPLADIVGDSEMELDYQFYFINGLTNDFTDQSTRGAHGNLELDNNNDKAFAGRLGLKLAPGQEIGFSGYSGKYDNDGRATGVDVDWRFTLGPAEIVGEYAYIGLDDGLAADGFTRVPGWYRGGYAQLNYHFWFDELNNTFLGRHFDSPTFTAVARLGQVEIDDDGDLDTGDNRERRLSLGLNYRPTEAWAFKLEYQLNDSHGEPIEHGKRDGFLFSLSATF